MVSLWTVGVSISMTSLSPAPEALGARVIGTDDVGVEVMGMIEVCELEGMVNAGSSGKEPYAAIGRLESQRER